jgi:Spy/CpxP family protein refolding chaperone
MKTSARTFTAFTQLPARLVLAALVVALAGGFTLAAVAAPPGPGAGHGGPDMMVGMPMMGSPQHIAHMLDSVGATAEQRTQVQQIMAAAATDLAAQRSSGRATQDQLMQLFSQPTVDARAAETLRQQMLTQHDTASKRMLQALLDVSRVLTPEQRKQLADHMAQRRSMMERHRSERDALEKPAR